MTSLYFHIPFCEKKCNYCSFFIVPQNELDSSRLKDMKDTYLKALKKDVDFQLDKFNLENEKIYSIYFGGGTPSEFGLNRIFDLLSYIKNKFDISHIQEFSFELNPIIGDVFHYFKINKNLSSFQLLPTLLFIEKLNNFVEENFFISARFSIGIQSLDDEILNKSSRNYTFKQIQKLVNLLSLVRKKFTKLAINLDFISFGLEEEIDKNYFEKFKKFVEENEKTIDSYSVYTLELFEGSLWKNKFLVNEEKILSGFKQYLKVLEDTEYLRYEISNFAKKGKESKHNLAYWQMKPYLGFGSSASGFVKYQNKYFRYTNSYSIGNYIKQKFSYYESNFLDEKQFLEEKIFLGLRKTNGIVLTDKLKKQLDLGKLNSFIDDGYFSYDGESKRLKITNKGLDVYNYIITEILDFS